MKTALDGNASNSQKEGRTGLGSLKSQPTFFMPVKILSALFPSRWPRWLTPEKKQLLHYSRFSDTGLAYVSRRLTSGPPQTGGGVLRPV